MISIILIALAVIFFIAIIITVIVINSRKNKNKEPEASILDVADIGVNDNHEFSYGYEKEATIVMDPVDPKKTDDQNIEKPKAEVFIPEGENKDE